MSPAQPVMGMVTANPGRLITMGPQRVMIVMTPNWLMTLVPLW
jgi:hypothetical protein